MPEVAAQENTAANALKIIRTKIWYSSPAAWMDDHVSLNTVT